VRHIGRIIDTHNVALMWQAQILPSERRAAINAVLCGAIDALLGNAVRDDDSGGRQKLYRPPLSI